MTKSTKPFLKKTTETEIVRHLLGFCKDLGHQSVRRAALRAIPKTTTFHALPLSLSALAAHTMRCLSALAEPCGIKEGHDGRRKYHARRRRRPKPNVRLGRQRQPDTRPALTRTLPKASRQALPAVAMLKQIMVRGKDEERATETAL